MDQRWLDLMAEIHQQGFAEVIFRFPNAPRKSVKVFVLSPELGTDLGELLARVRRFLATPASGWPAWPPANEGQSEGESESVS